MRFINQVKKERGLYTVGVATITISDFGPYESKEKIEIPSELWNNYVSKRKEFVELYNKINELRKKRVMHRRSVQNNLDKK